MCVRAPFHCVCESLAVMLADARAPAVLACAPDAVMLADARASRQQENVEQGLPAADSNVQAARFIAFIALIARCICMYTCVCMCECVSVCVCECVCVFIQAQKKKSEKNWT